MMFPPPHYLLFEPLNDKNTQIQWNEYKTSHSNTCDFDEIDAAEVCSAELFSPYFDLWVSKVCKKRFNILMIFHSEFLTYACQQMIRRSLEQRSYKCRVWFHTEDITYIQPAIKSRTILKQIPTYFHTPILITQ